MRTSSLALIATLALPVGLAAQAPRITPTGDPSVKSDSIYHLAVDPSKYPEYSVALLLDDGVIQIEADGRHRKTYRTIVQILKPDAEERYQEQTFSYAPKHERMTVNWVRVVKPSGEVVSDKPSHVQDSDVPAEEGDPVYSDRKVKRVSLTGVKAGTIVDYSYTTEELKPFLPGDFSFSWRVNPGVPVARSRYVVDMPSTLKARVVERNLDFKAMVAESGGRRVYTWAKANVPSVRSEALAADSNGVTMTIGISSPLGWSNIGAWYASNARTRYALTPAVEQKITEVIKGAKTIDDSIRAVHRWVAQDIRYVSIALGLGGYQPRTPDEVLRTGFGDCKDKATLFVAALGKLGVTAYPVLLNIDGGVQRNLPSIDQFNHVIAAVKRGGGYEYTDLTADLFPYGQLSPTEQGEFGVVVHPDGSTEEIIFPEATIDQNASTTSISGTLSDQGMFNGAYVEEARGARQYQMRELFRHPLDSAARANIPTGVARNYFEGARGDSLESFNGLDLSVLPRLRVVIQNGKAAEPAGNSMIFRLPFKNMAALTDAASELEREPTRRFTIDPQKFWQYGVSSLELRVRLPEGWRARLPNGVNASSAFGSFRSEYTQIGNELVVRRSATGAKGVQPPEKITDLIAWLRAVGKDDARMIVLEKPSGTTP